MAGRCSKMDGAEEIPGLNLVVADVAGDGDHTDSSELAYGFVLTPQLVRGINNVIQCHERSQWY